MACQVGKRLLATAALLLVVAEPCLAAVCPGGKPVVLGISPLVCGTAAQAGAVTAVHAGTGINATTVNSLVTVSAIGIPNAVLYAANYSGATFDVKVNACIAAVEAAGGGTCDARGLTGAQSMAADIVVGDGTHQVTLLLPGNAGSVATAISCPNASYLRYDSYSTIVGAGVGTDLACGIAPNSDITSGITQVQISGLRLNGPFTSGTVGLQIGAANGSVENSIFSNIGVRGFDTAVSLLAQSSGCTCYNHLTDIYADGVSYGTYVSSYVNSNIIADGGTSSGAIGIYDAGNNNVYIKPDVEGSATHGIELAGHNAYIIGLYGEGDGQSVIDSGATNNFILDWGILPTLYPLPGYSILDNSGNLTNFVFTEQGGGPAWTVNELAIAPGRGSNSGTGTFGCVQLATSGTWAQIYSNLIFTVTGGGAGIELCPGLYDGQQERIQACQDTSGGHTFAVTPFVGVSAIEWSGGSQPVLTTTASVGDIMHLSWDALSKLWIEDSYLANVPCPQPTPTATATSTPTATPTSTP